MKRINVTISFDDEKLAALKMYLEQKSLKTEIELEKQLEILYKKYVPSDVQGYLDLRSGIAPAQSKSRKTKSSSELSKATQDGVLSQNNGLCCENFDDTSKRLE